MASKALPLRLLHGGSYLAWVRDFGVKSGGVEFGRGLPCVVALARRLRWARKATRPRSARIRDETVVSDSKVNCTFGSGAALPTHHDEGGEVELSRVEAAISR